MKFSDKKLFFIKKIKIEIEQKQFKKKKKNLKRCFKNLNSFSYL